MKTAAFASALLGGGISLIASIAVLTLTNWLKATKCAREEKRRGAAQAFSGFHKLQQTAKVVMALANRIDTEYVQANYAQDRVVDPAQVVKPLIGSGFPASR